MSKKTCFSSVIAAALLPAILSTPSFAAFITAEWSNPVVAGNTADGATGALTFMNNAGTAAFSITSASSSNDTISWGVFNGTNNPCSIAPTPCSSTITFTGTSSVPADPTQPFQIGTITYTNGTSDLNSLIFGADLTFFKTTGNVKTEIGSDFVNLATTANTGTTAQNADYITFSGLANKSFNVFEGATAIGGLVGFIIGDPVLTLTDITVSQGQSANGFVGNSPPLPVSEPASLTLLGGALLGLGLMRRRRR